MGCEVSAIYIIVSSILWDKSMKEIRLQCILNKNNEQVFLVHILCPQSLADLDQ